MFASCKIHSTLQRYIIFTYEQTLIQGYCLHKLYVETAFCSFILSYPHSPALLAVFDFDSYVFEKFFCFLPEPPQDRNPVDEQLKSSGAFFIPHELGFRVLDFKVLGMFVRI